VVFGIRPEDVEVLDASSSDSIMTRVERREALGAEILVHLSLVDARETTPSSSTTAAPLSRGQRGWSPRWDRSGVAVGDQIQVRLNREHFHFFDADSGLSLRRNQ